MAVRRAVSLLHTHTIPSRVGKGEPGKGHGATSSQDSVRQEPERFLSFLCLWSWESHPATCTLPPPPGFPHLLPFSVTFWN